MTRKLQLVIQMFQHRSKNFVFYSFSSSKKELDSSIYQVWYQVIIILILII